MKKILSFSLLFVVLFTTFLIIYLKPRDYKEEYKIDGITVIEEYHKREKVYYFIIDDKYDLVQEIKFSPKRNRITKILQNENCITPYVDDRKLNQMCNVVENEVSYNIINGVSSNKVQDKIDGINIYNYLNNTFVLWNYNSVYIIEKGNNRLINLFNKDIYSNELTYLIKNLLVMPNYNSEYEYNELVLLDITSDKKDTWEIDYDLSNDGYIIGSYKKNLYLVDRKYRLEYEINPFRKKMTIVGSESKPGIIYKNNKRESATIKKLVNTNVYFEANSNYHYEISGKVLYLKYLDKDIKTKVIDFSKMTIVGYKDSGIYYISEDTFYYYSPATGNVKLIENFEWNFNSKNMIFIYNK